MPLKIIFLTMFFAGAVVYCLYHFYDVEQSIYKYWVKGEDSSLLKILYVVVRSVIEVGTMFYSRANTEVFYSLPASKNPVFVLIVWLVYMIAFYTTASALLIRFGNELLRWIRIIIGRLFSFDEVLLLFSEA